MQEFNLFSPSSWFVNGLEVVPREQQQKEHHAKPRAASWNVTFAASLLAIGTVFSAESLAFDPRESSIVFSNVEPNEQAPLQASTSQIQHDRSFASLFESYEAGRSLLSSESMRKIARMAVEAKPDANIDAWAERLANDVAKADD